MFSSHNRISRLEVNHMLPEAGRIEMEEMFTSEKDKMCSPTMWGEGHFCKMLSSSYAEQVNLAT